MGFFSDLGTGISSHIRAIEFIGKHKLWHYFLYPVAIMVVLFVIGFWSVMGLSTYISGELIEMAGLDAPADPESWTYWLHTIGSFLLGFVLKIFLLVILSSYIKYIVLIVCSPILALLSERIDEIITGKEYPFNLGQFVKDMLRGILVTLRNLVLETLLILACFFIGWIPVIGLITVPFLYIIAWYFMGFAMMDYSYERMRMRISEGARFTRRHKGIAIGNGFVFSMIVLIPIAGVIIAPILSVVAATLAVLEVKKEESPAAGHLA